MGNVSKKKINPYKKLIGNQPPVVQGDTLGEPVSVTNWLKHIEDGDTIKSFAKIRDVGKSKQAFVATAAIGEHFIPVREYFCGYYMIWILCVRDGGDMIRYRTAAAEIDFVLWNKKEEPVVNKEE
jgi:hypothetical protein